MTTTKNRGTSLWVADSSPALELLDRLAKVMAKQKAESLGVSLERVKVSRTEALETALIEALASR